MSKSKKSLPDYASPPVVEVIAGVQFEPLAIPSAWAGRWWDQIKDRFPHVQDQPPLDSIIEDFGPPQNRWVQIQMQRGLPNPRIWFSDAPNGSELLQIQSDRLIYNWRGHAGDQPYPRYEFVRERFHQLYAEYEAFLLHNDLGRLEPTQCELTYVNHIKVGQGWTEPASWTKVLRFWKNMVSPRSNLELEQANTKLSYRIERPDGKPGGRLHVIAEQRHFVKTGEPLLYLELTARGTPTDATPAGVLTFIDQAHELIVNTFDDLTEAEMHRLWRKSHA